MNVLSLLSSWVPVVAWAGLIYGLSSIPSLNSGWGVWDLLLRKGAHMFEFAVLTGLLFRATRRTWPLWTWRRMVMVSVVAATFYAASDEFHQSFVPGRGPSVRDVLIDAIGIGVAVLLLKREKLDA